MYLYVYENDPSDRFRYASVNKTKIKKKNCSPFSAPLANKTSQFERQYNKKKRNHKR